MKFEKGEETKWVANMRSLNSAGEVRQKLKHKYNGRGFSNKMVFSQ